MSGGILGHFKPDIRLVDEDFVPSPVPGVSSIYPSQPAPIPWPNIGTGSSGKTPRCWRGWLRNTTSWRRALRRAPTPLARRKKPPRCPLGRRQLRRRAPRTLPPLKRVLRRLPRRLLCLLKAGRQRND